MDRLAEAGREAMAAGDIPCLRRLFAFVASAAGRPDADHEIENAVAISCLEPGDFVGSYGSAARDLLPDQLRALTNV
jgi:hypothetical protein